MAVSLRTGWMIEDSVGGCHTSWHSAVEAYRDDPTLGFVELSFGVGGSVRRPVTAEVRRRAARTSQPQGTR